jgi:hypothetical protein
VLSARLDSVLNVLQGYLEADATYEDTQVSAEARQFFDQYMGIAREALDEFWQQWDPPSVEQVVQASEFVLRSQGH